MTYSIPNTQAFLALKSKLFGRMPVSRDMLRLTIEDDIYVLRIIRKCRY
jgi:hypothetical protein